jgi:hypothetical protein
LIVPFTGLSMQYCFAMDKNPGAHAYGCSAICQCRKADGSVRKVRLGSKAALTAPKLDFRFPSENGLNSDIAPCPKVPVAGLATLGSDFQKYFETDKVGYRTQGTPPLFAGAASDFAVARDFIVFLQKPTQQLFQVAPVNGHAVLNFGKG